MDLHCYLCFVSVVLSCLVVTCWERSDLLALLYVMFSCVFGTFPCSVLGQVWYLTVSNPDILPSSVLCSNFFFCFNINDFHP